MGGAEDAKLAWTASVAQALQAIASLLVGKLQVKSFWQLFTEWCDTPDARVPGVAAPDVCWRFLPDGARLEPLAPAPENNIYLFLELPLADPLSLADAERVGDFLSSTYWKNEEAADVLCTPSIGSVSSSLLFAS